VGGIGRGGGRNRAGPEGWFCNPKDRDWPDRDAGNSQISAAAGVRRRGLSWLEETSVAAFQALGHGLVKRHGQGEHLLGVGREQVQRSFWAGVLNFMTDLAGGLVLV
jgi:hypothetical protein